MLTRLSGRVVLSVEQIAQRVAELGEAITRTTPIVRPFLVGVLKGAFIFLADLARKISFRSSSTSWPFPPMERPTRRVASCGS